VHWEKAQAAQAGHLAEVALMLGALDERVKRGPDGWHQRLALKEVTALSWFCGEPVTLDRIALWMALRLSSAVDDIHALHGATWAVRRLLRPVGPEPDLVTFLWSRSVKYPHDDDREREREKEGNPGYEGGVRIVSHARRTLHPITRACYGYHLWNRMGLGDDAALEAAVIAARMAVGSLRGLNFVPIAMGQAEGLRRGGAPHQRLTRWLTGMETALATACQYLENVERWNVRARSTMDSLSGRTPKRLRKVLMDWPLVDARMLERLTGASRHAIQRNLLWMEEHQLIREVTGDRRFRMWQIIL